jgi:hypothetical protein
MDGGVALPPGDVCGVHGAVGTGAAEGDCGELPEFTGAVFVSAAEFSLVFAAGMFAADG